MITAACFLTFIAFYIFYHTSGKVKFNAHGFLQQHVRGNRNAAKMIAAVVSIIALCLFITSAGVCAGTLYYFITLMVSGSLVVLLTPLGIFSVKQVVPLFIVYFIVDYFLHY